MPIIQINNKKIHVLEMNEKATEAIVMVHGMFANLSVFYFKIAPELSKRFHVVLYDLQSHGMSERIESGYDLNTMSEDLIGLMDTLNISKAHLVGYSFGGLISLYTAIHYPNRINKLAIIEAPNPNDGKPRDVIERYSKEYLEQYVENLSNSTGLKPSARQLEKNHRLYEYLFNHSSISEDMLLYRDFFSEGSIGSISSKTLLLYANSSDCVSAGQFLNNNIKDSTLIMGDGDHNLPVQHPQWVADKLNSFI